MKVKINPEYLKRHLFALVVMVGLGGWFGWDGVVVYPKTDAVELYRSIEKSDPPYGFDVEQFKRQKTQTQYLFSGSALLVAACIAWGLYGALKFRFEFDDDSITVEGKRFPRGDIGSVNRSKWTTKGILALRVGNERDGFHTVKLDAWHHLGVREFEKTLC